MMFMSALVSQASHFQDPWWSLEFVAGLRNLWNLPWPALIFSVRRSLLGKSKNWYGSNVELVHPAPTPQKMAMLSETYIRLDRLKKNQEGYESKTMPKHGWTESQSIWSILIFCSGFSSAQFEYVAKSNFRTLTKRRALVKEGREVSGFCLWAFNLAKGGPQLQPWPVESHGNIPGLWLLWRRWCLSELDWGIAEHLLDKSQKMMRSYGDCMVFFSLWIVIIPNFPIFIWAVEPPNETLNRRGVESALCLCSWNDKKNQHQVMPLFSPRVLLQALKALEVSPAPASNHRKHG